MNMKKLNNRIGGLLLFLIFGSAFSSFGQAEKPVLIYDGRTREEISTAPTQAETKIVEKEVIKKEAVIKAKSSQDCGDENDFSIIGAASGSFTKEKSSQTAYLYELCRSARTFGIGGIVIVENGKIVSHNTYGDNGLAIDIASLPDINQNGLSEIVLISSGMGQGYSSGVIEIVEIGANGITSFGLADTYSDDYGVGNDKSSATAYKITAQTGKTPVYFRETYTQKGAEAKWILTKKAQKFLLRKDAIKYNKIG